MYKQKCSFCNKQKNIYTDRGSYSKGEIWIDPYSKTLYLEASELRQYAFPISYCPICGKLL